MQWGGVAAVGDADIERVAQPVRDAAAGPRSRRLPVPTGFVRRVLVAHARDVASRGRTNRHMATAA